MREIMNVMFIECYVYRVYISKCNKTTTFIVTINKPHQHIFHATFGVDSMTKVQGNLCSLSCARGLLCLKKGVYY